MISLFVFTALLAAAENPNCPEKDYSVQMGKTRNQGSSQWCHAFVAADLMGFAQGLRPPDQISALDVGIQHLTITKDRIADPQKVGVDPRSAALLNSAAVLAISKHQDSMLGAPVADRSQAYGTTASAMFAYLSQKGFCMEARLPSVGEGDEVKKYISNQLHRMVDKTRIDYNTDEPCPRIRNHPLNGVLSLSQKLNEAAMDTVAATANRACEPRKIGAPLKIKVSTHNYLGAKDDPTDAIAGLLDRGVPAGISLDIGFMYKGAAKVDHAASVVASHWNGETCEFKIRNTTADCSIYNEKYRGRCNGGHVWVSAEDLRYRVKNVFGALR